MDRESIKLAIELRDLLASRQLRLVLAESCTAGRVAATLAVLPGISQWFCGSWVVYRNGSKHAWLGVPIALLDDPEIGPVSSTVTQLLAHTVLQRTPEADWGIAVTGDVGPGAPAATDGSLFLAATRCNRADDDANPTGTLASSGDVRKLTVEQRVELQSPAPRDANDLLAREARLNEATQHVLRFAIRQVG